MNADRASLHFDSTEAVSNAILTYSISTGILLMHMLGTSSEYMYYIPIIARENLRKFYSNKSNDAGNAGRASLRLTVLKR